MEVFDAEKLRSLAHSSIIQQGKGSDIDRYIYQRGEGLGSLLGGLFRQAVPIFGQAIKGIGRVAKPHLIAASKDLLNSGAKAGVEKLTNLATTPRKRKAHHKEHESKRIKWQSL